MLINVQAFDSKTQGLAKKQIQKAFDSDFGESSINEIDVKVSTSQRDDTKLFCCCIKMLMQDGGLVSCSAASQSLEKAIQIVCDRSIRMLNRFQNQPEIFRPRALTA